CKTVATPLARMQHEDLVFAKSPDIYLSFQSFQHEMNQDVSQSDRVHFLLPLYRYQAENRPSSHACQGLPEVQIDAVCFRHKILRYERSLLKIQALPNLCKIDHRRLFHFHVPNLSKIA